MSQQEVDKAAYTLAKDFLPQSGMEGVTPELIEKYLHLSTTTPRPRTLAGIYERMLESAQNANMKAGVIGGSIGGVGNLRPVLCDFDPPLILEKYSAGSEDLLEDIVTQLKPRGSINRTPIGLWPKYCRTILSAAKFLSQFASADDFYEWVASFDKLDERARPALPMLLAYEIDGIGFALACDFLKELGYENFSKPDVHVIQIFQALGLCALGASDYEVFKAVARVAQNVGVTPYNVDKVFWLIGSGYFYDDLQIGKNGRIGSRKKEFINMAQPRLERIRHAQVSGVV
jgi:hypothetical protein